MKIMITGANGSIGSDLVNYFSNKNNIIYAFYRTPNNINKLLRKKNIVWIRQDLKKKINKKIKPKILIHSAITHPFSNKKEYLGYINSNINSLVNTVEFAKKIKIDSFIYLSSIKLYGDINDKKLNENTSISNPDILGVTKLLAEKIIELQSFKFYNIRLPGTLSYLINNKNRPWLNSIINNLIQNNNISINNPKAKFNNIIDTYEIFKFINHIINKKNNITNKTFIFSASKPIILEKLIKKIKNYTHSISRIKYNKKNTINFSIVVNRLEKTFNYKMPTADKVIFRYIDYLLNKKNS